MWANNKNWTGLGGAGDGIGSSKSEDARFAWSDPPVAKKSKLDASVSNHGDDDIHESDDKDNTCESFTLLSTVEAIVKHMDDCIVKANSVLQLPAETLRNLLNHFKWCESTLVDTYYNDDKGKLFKDAGVVDPYNRVTVEPIAATEECEICFSETPREKMLGVECGHRFCVQCWSDHVTMKIKAGGIILCAGSGCPFLLSDEAVITLVSDEELRHKYRNHILDIFVQCNPFLKWCPRPHCKNVIVVKNPGSQQIACPCSKTSYCFQCSHDWHDPVCCDWLGNWVKKCAVENFDQSKWLIKNTKECPKCKTTIEKNGGCNHMTCGSSGCRYEFCWICLGDWKAHKDNWNCRRFVEDTVAGDAQARTRYALKRFHHYYTLYMSQRTSLQFEYKLDEAVDKRIIKLLSTSRMSKFDVNFLKKAVDVLHQCRQALAYSYVFAYHNVRNTQMDIFEKNLADLNLSTERLSGYMEHHEKYDDDFDTMKQMVKDSCRYCENRRKALVDHVREGFEKDWWEYNTLCDVSTENFFGARN